MELFLLKSVSTRILSGNFNNFISKKSCPKVLHVKCCCFNGTTNKTIDRSTSTASTGLTTRVRTDPSLVDLSHAREDYDVTSAVVYPDILEAESAELLTNELLSILKQRRRYEKGHWDAVILKYKETELSLDSSTALLSKPCIEMLRLIQEAILRPNHCMDEDGTDRRNAITFLPCHVIELHRDGGQLKAHVDSVRFSGGIVAGLSLQADAIMRLRPALPIELDTPSTISQKSQSQSSSRQVSSTDEQSYVDLMLPRNSLYVLTGMSRYNYTHELLQLNEQQSMGSKFYETLRTSTVSNNKNRISVIFRDALHQPLS